MFYPIVTAAAFAADYFVKKKVDCCLQEGQEKEILGGHFVLNKKTNKGLACRVLEERPDTAKKISAALCGAVGICWIKALCSKKHPAKKLGLSLLFGGGLANLFSRCQNGAVTDYLSIKKKDGTKGKLCFNVSDVFIALGGILTAFSKE